MMMFNISPDTIIQEHLIPDSLKKYYDIDHISDFLENGIPPELTLELKRHEMTMTLNGVFYTTKKIGFIPKIVGKVFKQRKAEKNIMLDYEKQLEAAETEYAKCEDKDRLNVLKESIFNLETFVNIHHNTQLALKTLMNALYGACANEYFRHFNFYNAEGITSSGQYSIQYNTKEVDNYINKICGTNVVNVIYNDTDSISISLQGVVDKTGVNRNDPRYVDTLCKFADTVLNKQTEIANAKLATELNVFENRLSFKREKVFVSGLYVVKKRYALLVIDDEGVRFSEPKIKITGLEIKRSDTPQVCRDAMEKVLKIILTGAEPELIKYVSDFESEFMKLEPETISLPSGVNNLAKYSDRQTIYAKGTPMHVRATLLYNHHIKKMGLDNSYEMIDEGGNVKYIKLKMPNIFRENVIGYASAIPKEFNLKSVVDYDQMYQDTFLIATKRLTDAAGWNLKHVENVESWFD